MAELRTIESVEEDQALIAYRAIGQMRAHGYERLVEQALTDAGLADYLDSDRTTITFDRDQLMTVLNPLMAPIAAHRADTHHRIQDRVDTVTRNVRNDLLLRIQNGQIRFTFAEPAAKFTERELADRYGLTGALPRPAGEHAGAIEQARKDLAMIFARRADDHGPCADFEACVARVGLKRYFPEREISFTAEVPGIGEVPVSGVVLNRQGKIDRYALQLHIQAAATGKFQDMMAKAVIKGLPEEAVVG